VKHKSVVVKGLLLLSLLCPSKTKEADLVGVQLRFNDQPYSAENPVVTLPVGRANQLGLEVASHFLAGRTLRVVLTRILPTGEEISEKNTLDESHRQLRFELGPMAAPPVYDYEAGLVYQRGYGLFLSLEDDRNRKVAVWQFHQSLAKEAFVSKASPGMGGVELPVRPIYLRAGTEERVIFDPKLGAPGPLSLRLAQGVLLDPNDLQIQVRLNPGETPDRMMGTLRVLSEKGKELWRKEIAVQTQEGWQTFRLQPNNWAVGDYSVELRPFVGAKDWPDGPRVVYRRRPIEGDALLVSPFAPWKLRRDPARNEIAVTDFRNAYQRWGTSELDSSRWGWRTESPGQVALLLKGDFTDEPLTFRFPTRGSYAVFARFKDAGGLIQVGREKLIRAAAATFLGSETFFAAADLTNEEIRIYPGSHPQKWKDSKGLLAALVALRLVPVTAESVQSFYREMANPPVPMMAVDDWAEYFGLPWSRLLPDQFASIVCGQAEIGFRTLGWSVGRSWLEYHSQLPHAKLFPCVPYEAAKAVFDVSAYDYGRRIVMINQYDPLKEVYQARASCQAEIWPWLPMQRHYGAKSYGGMFACPFYRDHPQWWRIAKDGSDSIGLSFFFPEVRKERVDILLEVAEKGADGLVVGCDRQVPMLLYNSEMVKAYRQKTGVDPLKIDAAHGKVYEEWIRWRADFFTQVLRDLQQGLEPIRTKLGKRIPVAIRIPSGGLFFNLAQGLDVEQWCRERLIDQIQLDPLEDLGGRGRHDIRPYLGVARRYGISVIGGMGSTSFLVGLDGNPGGLVPGLKRALGLLQAGVDGMDTYETEVLALADSVRFAVTLFGHPERLKNFLKDSNIEACFPIDANTAAAGHDNHSRWGSGWDVYGYGPKSL